MSPPRGHSGGVPTIYLVRHAKAASRESWHEPDVERPLTPRGRAQAGLIADELKHRDGRTPSRVVSSAAVRCRETVADLAHVLGLRITDVDWLMEGSNPVEAFERLRRLARRYDPSSGHGGPVAACSHGDVIWGVLECLERRGVDLGRDPDVPKGSVWILEFPGGALPTAGRLKLDTARL